MISTLKVEGVGFSGVVGGNTGRRRATYMGGRRVLFVVFRYMSVSVYFSMYVISC